MNYLAHLYLARHSSESLIGALLGDFVKGTPPDTLHPETRSAIIHHRRIDSFTDHHPLHTQSRNRLSPRYRLLRGILIDLFYDHFLALHWDRFSNETLDNFTQDTYAALIKNSTHYPKRLQDMLPRMINEDWLGSYREPENIERALRGISHRLSRPTVLAEGYQELQTHYPEFEQDFLEFFPQLQLFSENLSI